MSTTIRKKTGILLAFPPKTPLSNQGIGRLLTMLLNETQDDQITSLSGVVIAAPRWCRNDINSLLADNNVPAKDIEVHYTKNMPIFIHLVNIASLLRGESKGRLKLLIRQSFTKARKAIEWIFAKTLSVKNPLIKTLLLPFLIVSFIAFIGLVGWLALQKQTWLAIVCLSAMGLAYIIYNNWKLIIRILGKRHNSLLKSLIKPLRNINKRKSSIRSNKFFFDLFIKLRTNELHLLIGDLNKRDDIGMWYIPTAFWPEVEFLAGPKVIAVPDVVFLDYPTQFISHNSERTHDIMTQTLRTPSRYLCYSQHVKQRHLVDSFGIEEDFIHVIPHGRSELHQHLAAKGASMRAQSLAIIRKYQSEKLSRNHYLTNFDFSQTRFFLYSSQARPYKNLLNLVQAYHRLLRHKRVDAKLILTGKLGELPYVHEYVLKHRLQMDIIEFHNVSSSVLAALNNLAIAAINPSLFEGGFPFTFSEAYSVGTPSIMSDTPHVRETVTDPALAQMMLFDPYNVDAIASKMAWAVEHRDALLAAQKPLYDNQPSWSDVASRYHKYFGKVAYVG